MGDVVVMNPLSDVLHFEGAAQEKAAQLLEQMIVALKRAMEANNHDGFLLANDEVQQLQKSFATGRQRVEWLEEVCSAANRDRRLLWESVAEGRPTKIIYRNPDKGHVVVLDVTRSGTKVTNTNFNIYEGATGSLERCV